MGKLVLYLPDGTIHDIPLDKERVSIGRRPDNDVCLPYPAVSGEHAVVVNILDDSFLEDLGSTNGTLVNGKPILKHFLRDNDSIDIGRQRLIYFSNIETRAEPLPPDILRRDIQGLQEQVERARGTRVEAPPKPLAGPGGNGPRTVDPLLPDDELIAELESGAFPNEKKFTPPASVPLPTPVERKPQNGAVPRAAAAPKQKDPSALAARLASTWAEPVAETTPKARPAMGERAVQPPAPGYAIRVVTGPSAGRVMPITREQFSVGRVGTQVARIAGSDGGFRLVRIEGAEPVVLNGNAIPDDGAFLAPGDRFTVAGVELAFERR